MRLVILFILCCSVFFPGFAQENFYGDYAMYDLEKDVSLDLESARLVDVLKMLSQQTSLNFVSTDAVRDRKLTLYMEKVPLKEAMDILFKANNLTYDYYPESKIFVVKEMGRPSLEIKTKIYYLKHLYVAQSRLQTEIDLVMGETNSGSDEDSENIQNENGIKAAVKAVLSEAGKVVEDPTTNSLIVVDVPSQFAIIDEIVSMLDVPVAKVMIEVEMLDVSTTTVDSMGIKWPENLIKADVMGQRVTSFPFGSIGTKENFVWGSGVTTPSGNWDIPAGLSANKFGPTVLTVIGADLALNFLRTQSDTKFLARPKILTLSNQTAEIRITTDEAIGIKKTEGESGDITFDVDRTETGTRLRVTPLVSRDSRDITLFVEMEVKEALDSGNFAAADGSFITGTIKDPEERSAKGVVRLKDGQTLFMGGLSKKNKSKSGRKIPILGDIPFVGRLFRHKGTNEEERELMVFLTPHVLNDIAPVAKTSSFSVLREQFNPVKGKAVKLALDSFVR